jgi:transcriptional regulator with XRE-family HTH domain
MLAYMQRSWQQHAERTLARLLLEIGEALREPRLAAGVSLEELAGALKSSEKHLSHVERGKAPGVGLAALHRQAAVLGQRLVVNVYPVGAPIRDAGQVRLIGRFVERIGNAWQQTLEAPLPIDGDLRAVDLLLRRVGLIIAVEAITRLRDLQAQLRAAQLKQRDIGARRLLIVAADTKVNRSVMAASRSILVSSFELDARRLFNALQRGEDPGRDGILLL